MTYISSIIGNEISTVMHGINKKILNNNNLLLDTLEKALKKDKFTILGKSDYKFKPQGYTLVILLAESHVAIHTYPEHNSIYFYIYSCRKKDDGQKIYQAIKKVLKPKSVDIAERNVIVKR